MMLRLLVLALTAGLLVVPTFAQQLTLTWTDNATTETAFIIQRGDTATGPFIERARTGIDVTTYVDDGVVWGATYCYRVAATDGTLTSTFSNVACATVAMPPPTITYTLTIGKSGPGTVSRAPTGTTCGSVCWAYPSGTVVTLTAKPYSNAHFVGWSGGGCSGSAALTCAVTMSGSKSVSASFAGGTK